MSLNFGLEEMATEGEHLARIVTVNELPQQKGQFRTEDKVKIIFEMLDQPDANGDYARASNIFALKVSRGSRLGKFLDDMGWPRDGKPFNIQWLVGETLRVNIQHACDGKFANVTHAIKDPAVLRMYRPPCSSKGCKEFVNPCMGDEMTAGRCYQHCYGEAL